MLKKEEYIATVLKGQPAYFLRKYIYRIEQKYRQWHNDEEGMKQFEHHSWLENKKEFLRKED